ncbi:MAG: chemotaxis protein CheW [Leptospirillia bacterium]
MSTAVVTLPEQEEDESLLQLVTFSLNGELFALDILKVQEIIRVSSITPVPHTPAYVEGVITLRGQILPIIDLGTRFGLARSTYTNDTRIMVVNVNQVVLGVAVDSVHEVTRMREEDMEPASAMGGNINDYVLGIGKFGGKLITVVDIDAIALPLGG